MATNNNVHIAKRDVVYLDASMVRNSPGFSFDLGSSLIKIVFRSKEDFNQGKPLHDKVIQDGRARVHVVSIPRESDANALCEFIKQSCDVSQSSTPGQKVKVVITGIGASLWKKDLKSGLEDPLNIELTVAMEDVCFAVGFQCLKDTLSEEELCYPPDEKGLAGAKEFEGMIRAWHASRPISAEEIYSKVSYQDHPKPEGPCVPSILCVCGSASIITHITEKGEYIALDGMMFAGKSFLGFAEYMLGKVGFDEFVRVLETSDGRTVDSHFSSVVDTSAGDTYNKLGETSRRIFAFGDCVGANKDAIKPEDMVHSFFLSIAETLSMLAYFCALSSGSKHIFFTGSFINIRFARQIITAEIEGRNLTKPENQQVGYSFVRHGGYCGVVGAFLQGAAKQ